MDAEHRQSDPISVPEMAAILGVKSDKARQWCRRGMLPAWNVGEPGGNETWKAERRDVLAFRDSRRAIAARIPEPVGSGPTYQFRRVPAHLRG
jgi:hypothetical protein